MSDKTTDPKPSIEELRAEIQQTRAELGETVQALAAKADVKGRALDQVEHAKQRVRVVAGEAQQRVRTSPVPVALVVAGVAALVGIVLIIHGRKR